MQKKAAPKASKAAAKAPLAPTTSHNIAQQGGKAIEEIYQKKSQLEHILLRPDTYIGSTEKQQQVLWVHDGEKMVFKNITYAPGLFKIFDEILVNAADNKVRDPSMDTIRVDISPVSSSTHISTCKNRQNVLIRCSSVAMHCVLPHSKCTSPLRIQAQCQPCVSCLSLMLLTILSMLFVSPLVDDIIRSPTSSVFGTMVMEFLLRFTKRRGSTCRS